MDSLLIDLRETYQRPPSLRNDFEIGASKLILTQKTMSLAYSASESREILARVKEAAQWMLTPDADISIPGLYRSAIICHSGQCTPNCNAFLNIKVVHGSSLSIIINPEVQASRKPKFPDNQPRHCVASVMNLLRSEKEWSKERSWPVPVFEAAHRPAE